MRIILLGTGTSQGIPVICCQCEACLSEDPRDNRLRSSVYVSIEGVHILIDTSPDLRQQMLANNIPHVDAILFTHEHNDHIIGFDDIRPFNFQQGIDMPVYGLRRVLDELQHRFAYVFDGSNYPGAPRAIPQVIDGKNSFVIKGINITPIEVQHGTLPILGYRIGGFSFITDASSLDSKAMTQLEGSEVLVINALQRESHSSHFTLYESLEIIKEINPRRAYITHTSHRLGPTTMWEKELPQDVFAAYDGLTIDI